MKLIAVISVVLNLAWALVSGIVEGIAHCFSDDREPAKNERRTEGPQTEQRDGPPASQEKGNLNCKEAVAKPREGLSPSRPRPRQSAALPSGNGGFATGSKEKTT